MSSSFSHDFEQTPDEIRIGLFAPPHAGYSLSIFPLFWVPCCLLFSLATLFGGGDFSIPARLLVVTFLVPFWTVGIYFVCGALTLFYRRDEFRLAADGVTFTIRVLMYRDVRHIPLEELIAFRGPDSYAAADGPMSGVEVVSLGKGFYFNPHLPKIDDRHLVQRLNARLQELRERRNLLSPPDGSLADCRSCPLPLGAHWREIADSDGVILERREEWSRLAKVALPALNVYWITHVGVLLVQLAEQFASGGIRDEGQSLVVAVGFAGVGLLLMTLYGLQRWGPCRVTQWRVTETDVERRVRCLGFRFTRRFGPDSLRLVVIVEPPRSELNETRHRAPRRARFQVSGWNAYGGEFWSIGGLTLAEALWVKGRIQAHVRSVATSPPEVFSTTSPPPAIPATTDVPGRPRELALCVECLEPLGPMAPDAAVGIICPNCRTVQPSGLPAEADTESFLADDTTSDRGRDRSLNRVRNRAHERTLGRDDDDSLPESLDEIPLPEGIVIERSGDDSLRFSILAIPEMRHRLLGSSLVVGWGLIMATVLFWIAWSRERRDTLFDPIDFYAPQVMAVLALLMTGSIGLLILMGRTTVDMCRDGLLIRWGWGILSWSLWAPLNQINGFRIERITARSQKWGTVRRYQRPVGVVVVQGRPWMISTRNRTFLMAILRLMQTKLNELRRSGRSGAGR